MPPRRSVRRAKATSRKSTRISNRQAVQSTGDAIKEEIEVEEVEIKQEEINENDIGDDDLEPIREQLKGDNDDNLDDKSRVVAFEDWQLDGVLEENVNINGNEGANQNSVEKETPAAAAADEVVNSFEHMDNISRVQEGIDNEGTSANGLEDVDDTADNSVLESPMHMENCSRVQEGGDKEGKSANVVEDGEHNEDDNVIQSPGHLNDFMGVQEGGDGEEKSGDKREGADNVKNDECSKGKNIMKSPGHLDDFLRSDGDEEGKRVDNMEDDEDNNVNKLSALMDDISGVQEGRAEEEKNAFERESIDGVEDNEVNNFMKSPGHADEFIGVQDDGDEELKSADDMEDDGDGEDNKVMESLGHLDDCTEVQEGCDEEGDGANDVGDNEDSNDTEEVEDPSLTSSGKQRQLEIHVTTVHVKGLVKSWNLEKLKEICKQYGEVVNVRLPRNFGARRKDFGFIDFSSQKSALTCVEGINNTQLGGETKVKADLAKTRFGGKMQKKMRQAKHHAKYKETENEIKAQAHGDKSKGTGKRGRGTAKEESQAPSLRNSTKESKPNNHRTSFSKGQDANPVKTDGKIKNLPPKMNDRGKRKIDYDHNRRQSKKSRGNAQGRQGNRNSARKSHHKEGNSSISGSKRHHSDMEPHAGYIEPATRKPARHYAEAAYMHQGLSHASYLQHTLLNQSQPSVRYIEPGFGRQASPHAGYIEPAAEKQGFVAYDYSLRRAGGYSGQGNQGSAYVRGSAVPPSYAQNYTNYNVYQDVAGFSRYHHSSGTYLPRQQYY